MAVQYGSSISSSQPMARGQFLESPGNFSNPEANIKVQACWIAAEFLAHEPVSFASIIDSFILLFLKSLKLWSWINAKQLSGPEEFPGLSRNRPRVFSQSRHESRWLSIPHYWHRFNPESRTHLSLDTLVIYQGYRPILADVVVHIFPHWYTT